MTGRAVEVRGLRRLQATMRRANLDMRELKDLHRRAAGIVLGPARAATPRGPGEGGHISTSVRAGATGKAGIVRAGTGLNGRFPYGGPLHWGWTSRRIRSQPWLTTAAKRTEPLWLESYLQGINDLLDKVEGI